MGAAISDMSGCTQRRLLPRYPSEENKNIKYFIFAYSQIFKAGRGVDAQSVTVKSAGCGFDPYSRK